MRWSKQFGLLLAWVVGLLVLLLAGSWAVGQYLAREDTTFSWDHTVENPRATVRDFYGQDGKHPGVSLAGAQDWEIEPLLRNNVEWVAVTPFGWQEDIHSTVITRNPKDGERWGPQDDQLEALITTAKQRGLRVFLKPHLWLTHSRAWRSEIEMNDEASWQQWFESYRTFIVYYAAFAESLDVDLLSVGTELTRAATLREADWRAFWASPSSLSPSSQPRRLGRF